MTETEIHAALTDGFLPEPLDPPPSLPDLLEHACDHHQWHHEAWAALRKKVEHDPAHQQVLGWMDEILEQERPDA